jgi:superfamily II DNA or RNA helicase
MLKPFLRNMYWFPKSYVSMNCVKKNFTVVLGEGDDGEDIVIEAWKTRRIGKYDYIGMPRGKPNLVKQSLINPKKMKEVRDRRSSRPVKIPLKFLGELRKEQKPAIKALAKVENGVLKSAPRTGKCLHGDTLIFTDNGIFKIKDLPTGSLIKDTGSERWYKTPRAIFVAGKSNFEPVKAIYHSEAELFTVETNLGYHLTGTADERLNVNGEWKKIEDLEIGDELVLQSRPVWRKGIDYSLNRQDSKVFPHLTIETGTLLAYASIIEKLDSKHGEYRFSSTSSCQKFLAKILEGIEGYRFEHDEGLYHIPDEVWAFLARNKTSVEIPHIVLKSRKKVLTAYLRGLYECSSYQKSKGTLEDSSMRLSWDVGNVSLAKQIQTVLVNFMVYVGREGSHLYADEYNTKAFFKYLNIRGMNTYGIDGPRPPSVRVSRVRAAGHKRVYDLSVGRKDRPGTHNFIANGIWVHNTIMGTAAIVKQQQKTLILAHQTDLIEQFCNETINDPAEKLFNGNRLKKPIAKICNKLEDFEKHNICLATYQTFIRPKGRKLLRKIRRMFGIVLVDEVHRVPADQYASIMSEFQAAQVWGLTATDDRKDGRYALTELLIGPVKVRTKAKSLSATVYGHKTSLKCSRTPKTWNGILSFLIKNDKRNEMIAAKALKDVKDGHIVLIPIVQHQHAEQIKQKIHYLGGDKSSVFTFTGQIPKNKRQWARDEMNNNSKLKIIIAMRSMLTGMNIPRWSAIYTVSPISNVPNYEQEVKRICTPMEGKKTPIIRYFFDDCLGMSYGCLRTCLKTLENPENGFVLDKTFMNIASIEGTESSNRAIDDIEVARSNSSKRMKF